MLSSNLDYLCGVENASKLRNEANHIITKYLLEKYNIRLEYSTRLKLSGGNIEVKKRSMDVIIKLNFSYFQKFGIERSIATLRHEFAHLIQYDRRGKMGHDFEFKSICARLGGSMCAKQAGTTFAASATDQYAERIYKYSYTCPTCGATSKRVRRMSADMRNSTRHSCARCRTKLNKFIEKEI